MWPFKHHPKRGEPPSKPTSQPDGGIIPSVEQSLVEAFLTRAAMKAREVSAGDSFVVKVKKHELVQYPYPNLFAEVVGEQAHRYGIEYQSSYEREFTFIKR